MRLVKRKEGQHQAKPPAGREGKVFEKFVSAGVCFRGKGRLHFVDEMKVDALYYVSRLLSQVIEDCKQLMPAGFIFQQDGAPVIVTLLYKSPNRRTSE